MAVSFGKNFIKLGKPLTETQTSILIRLCNQYIKGTSDARPIISVLTNLKLNNLDITQVINYLDNYKGEKEYEAIAEDYDATER